MREERDVAGRGAGIVSGEAGGRKGCIGGGKQGKYITGYLQCLRCAPRSAATYLGAREPLRRPTIRDVPRSMSPASPVASRGICALAAVRVVAGSPYTAPQPDDSQRPARDSESTRRTSCIPSYASAHHARRVRATVEVQPISGTAGGVWQTP